MARTQQEIDQILQSCLESIQDGEEDIDALLGRYPDLAEDLLPQLEAALWLSRYRHIFDPKPGFVPASRRRLMARIRELPTPVRTPQPRPILWGFFANLGGRRFALQLALIFLLVFALLAGGYRVVQAAETSIPGDALYVVKLVQERVQLAVTLSPADDARLYIKFAQRRVVEIQSIILEGRDEFLERTVKAYGDQISRAINAIKIVAGRDQKLAAELAAQMENALSAHTSVFMVLSEAATRNTRAQIDQIMAISRNGLMEAQALSLTSVSLATGTTTPTPTVMLTGSLTPEGPLVSTGTVTTSLTATPTGTETLSQPQLPSQTNTLEPGSVTSPTPTSTSTRLPAAAPTSTPTPTKVHLPEPTSTPTPTRTSPPGPTNTPTLTPTLKPPSPTPTNTSPPGPTQTPTNTPNPTSVPTATPTTPPPPPPTDTPPPAPSCKVRGNLDAPFGNKLELRMQNVGSGMATVARIEMRWPVENEFLKEVLMGDQTIWKGQVDPPSVDISQWSGDPAIRQISVGAKSTLRFDFKRDALPFGYAVTVYFAEDCDMNVSR